MHVVVVANGELPAGYTSELASILSSAELVIAADGGLLHCQTLGIWPDVVVGDLDSASTALVEQARLAGVEVRSHPADKDATDLELALQDAVAAQATTATVITPFGGRLDHELATIALLASHRWHPLTLAATDGRRHVSIVRSDITLRFPIGQTLSLIPWGGDVAGVTTSGLQWPLHEATLPLGTTRGVSNVAVANEQNIAISSGTLLAVVDLVG